MTVRINASSAGLTETVDTTGILEFQTANTSALVIGTNQNANFTSTGAIILPTGTTNNRPTAVNGMIRYNTDSGGSIEGYINGNWVTIKSAAYSISYLIVAGGGSGNNGWINADFIVGGGGGAGGYLFDTATLIPGTAYPIVVGAGGAWVSVESTSPPGANTTGFTVTAIGGGGGGKQSRNGGSGGSGGGGGGNASGAGLGTAGQGNNGGDGSGNSTGGGGGGAGSAGGTPTAGAGAINSISGSSVTYAAGGAGGTFNGGNGVAGAANTGNGAKGAQQGQGAVGANGGSGIVIVAYAGAQRGTGGTVTSVGGNTIHTFTTSGTYTA
jgi:hypothetical protein